MKRRDKWILIVVLIGCVACGIAPVAYLGYFVVFVTRDLNRLEAHRPVLLYQTDHRALLEACRELSRQVATGGRTRYMVLPTRRRGYSLN